MEILENAIAFIIIAFLILLVWSRVMHQRMIDTLAEIRDFIASLKQANEE